MSNIVRLCDHTPKSMDCYFFDSNVWIFLFFPMLNHRADKQAAYAQLLNDIQTVRGTIFINSLVLSEFCNVWLRYRFNAWKTQQPRRSTPYQYKRDYVGTEDYIQNAGHLKRLIEGSILPLTELWTDNIRQVGFDKILQNFGVCDFNDSYYLSMTEVGQKCMIVTDDKDLLQSSIVYSGTIVTM